MNRWAATVALALALLGVWSPAVAATVPPSRRQVVLLLVDGLRPRDAAWVFRLPAGAWLDVRDAAGPAGGVDATFGAGTRLPGPLPAVRSDPPGLQVAAGVLRAAAKALPYAARPGALGAAVRRAGGCTAAYGGAGAAVVAMDAQGRVDRGSLAPWPPGATRLPLGPHPCALTVVELGAHAARALLPHLQRRPDRLILLAGTPAPPAGAARGGLLLPAGAAGLGTGLLASPSTRRPGLVANTDLAPTALAYLGMRVPATMIGRPWHAAPGQPARMPDLAALGAAAAARRPWLLRGYVYLQALLVPGALLAAVLRRGASWARPALRAATAVPLAFLALGWAPWASPAAAGALVAAVSLALAAVCPDMLTLALVSVAGVCLDLLRGGAWMLASPLGYSLASGARYYGLGDQYEGLLIGAVLAGAGLAHDRCVGSGVRGAPRADRARRVRTGLTVCVAAVTLLAGWPGLGTNVGGLLAGGVGLAVFRLDLRAARRRPERRHAVPRRPLVGRAALPFVAAGGAVLVAVAASGWIDARLAGPAATHLGQTARLVEHAGPAALVPVAVSRALVNLRLIRSTAWSVPLLAYACGFAAAAWWRPRPFRRVTAGRPGTAAALAAVAAATLANLLGQDFGIAAAALDLTFGSAVLLDLALAGSRNGVATPPPADRTAGRAGPVPPPAGSERGWGRA